MTPMYRTIHYATGGTYYEGDPISLADAQMMLSNDIAEGKVERLIPLSQVSLDSGPPTEHDRGRWPFLTRSSHFSNGFRTKRIAPSSCLSAAGRMASFVLGAVGSGVTC